MTEHTVRSVGQVELSWPAVESAAEGDGPTLSQVEAMFVSWLREARRRGCPETAVVGFTNRATSFRADLTVAWDAGPPAVSDGAGAESARSPQRRPPFCVCPNGECNHGMCRACERVSCFPGDLVGSEPV